MRLASLTITRDSGYADALRAYQVVLDGEKLGTLKAGETKQFLVSVGPHDLLMKIDWCGSNTVRFNIVEGDDLSFYAKSNLRGFKFLFAVWYTFFARNSYILLEKSSNSQARLTH
jgi:hypothetical protein